MERIEGSILRLGLRSYMPFKFAADLFLWTMAVPLAFLLRLETDYFYAYFQEMVIFALLGLILKGSLIFFFGLHRQSWRKVGVRDLYMLLQAVGIGSLSLAAIAFVLRPVLSIPRSIPLLDGILALLMLGLVRLLFRVAHEQGAGIRLGGPARRVLIVGAGESGTMLAREMLRHPEAGLEPVGYLDDERTKQRQSFYGVQVIGPISTLPQAVRRLKVEEVLIAMPTVPGEVIRRVVTLAHEAGVRYRIVPGYYEILSGKTTIAQLREVNLEDLLRRDPVRLDMAAIASYLAGRVVLITGAAGSIGSEIARQVARFAPGMVILLDRDENNLYLFERELRHSYPNLALHAVVADVQRPDKLERIFEQYHPQVVFHAAANKHVPVMEANPDEAILNNVGGTRNLARLAIRYDVERFVNISTDKVVRPSSVMGASKRVAEFLVGRAAREAKPGQCFVSVRFGNVLGSQGSVVPIFREQIRRGGPVTVTHPEATRYFMSIPEAVQLVLQAAGLGENGVLYVLDMGDPVRIMDLARDLIELSGLKPDVNIPIEFTGLRPGEKLHEELLTDEENLTATRHEKILFVRPDNRLDDQFDTLLEELFVAAHAGDATGIRRTLKKLIPRYQYEGDPPVAPGTSPDTSTD